MKKLLPLLAIALSFTATGQIYTSFYNFDHVNQSLMINPAAAHPHRTVVGIPGLSGLSAHITNSMFEAGDYFNDNPLNQNIETIINRMDEVERINLYQNLDLLWVGFGTKKGYFSFGVQQEVTFNTMLPSNLAKFLYYGNAAGDGTINFTSKNFNTEALIQINYHLGYQHWLLDSTLIIGGRVKYISGTGHVHFKDFDASLQSDIFEWRIKTNILLESSGYQYLEDFADNANPLQLITSGNSGWAGDIGATYLLNKFKFSASLLNIGYIKWNKNLKMYQSKGEFVFDGVEINEEDPEMSFEDILDSLEAALGFNEISPYSYRSTLPSHLMGSVEYGLTPKHAIALTYQGSLWSGNLYSNVGINYIGRWARHFNFLLGYSRLNGALNNVALGLSAGLGPVQIYLMTDNAWGFYKIKELSSTSVRFGLNIAIPDKKVKKPKESTEKI
jgi:hypothetical protein